MGSNLYQRYINRLHARQEAEINGNNTDSKEGEYDPELPESRNIPPGTKFYPQTAKEFIPLLVETGKRLYLAWKIH